MSRAIVRPESFPGRVACRLRVKAISCLFCFVLSTSFAQDLAHLTKPPSSSQIEEWLFSEDPRLVAWGAHYAVATGAQVAPSLASLADAWQSMSGAALGDLSIDQLDRRDAMAAVLDALIQMHASVSVDTLRNLAADFPNYVAILLSRMSLEDSQALSLEFYHAVPKNAYNLQYVSASLLAEAPAAGIRCGLVFQHS